jgi:hypothetical protein
MELHVALLCALAVTTFSKTSAINKGECRRCRKDRVYYEKIAAEAFALNIINLIFYDSSVYCALLI